MTREANFDLSRKAYESWPYMFGLMYWSIFEASKAGIEQAIPQVHMLAQWCRPFFSPDQNQAYRELRDHDLDWPDLHDILDACLAVAQQKGAWEFRREHMEESAFAPG